MPAPTAPTTFAVKQIYTDLPPVWWQANSLRTGAQLRRGSTLALPEYLERRIELTWVETEAGAHSYELKQNRGTAQDRDIGQSAKGALSNIITGLRYRRAPKWIAYALPVSIRATSAGGQSAWVDLTVNDDPKIIALTPPTVAVNFSADGANLSWTGGTTGALGALVSARGIGESATISEWIVLPPNRKLAVGRSWPVRQRDAYLEELPVSVSSALGRLDNRSGLFFPVNAASFEFAVQLIYLEAVEEQSGRIVLGPPGVIGAAWTPSDATFAFAGTTLNVANGEVLNYPLSTLVNAASTFSITSGSVAWINLVDGILEIAPTATGNTALVIEATRASDSVTKTATIYVRSSPTGGAGPVTAAPVIVISNSLLNNGLTFEQGQPVIVQFSATGATEWQAAALPDGLSINRETGLISGAITTPGRYTITLRARAENSPWSAPKSLAIKITTSASGINLAAYRFPWLATEWTFTDLQIDLVTRAVTSSRAEAAGVPVKRGDDLQIPVFLISGGVAISQDDLEEIGLILRPLNNLDDAYKFTTSEAPEAVEREGSFYYLLEFKLESPFLQDDLEDAAAKLARDATALPAPVICLGEIQLTVAGKVRSSQHFKVAVMLDALR